MNESDRKDAIAQRYYKALAEWKALSSAMEQEMKHLTITLDELASLPDDGRTLSGNPLVALDKIRKLKT